MNLQPFLKQDSVFSLLQVMVNNRAARHRVMDYIAHKTYKEVVEENVDNRPRQVQEDKYRYSMALLHGLDRAIERRLMSKNVIHRFTDVFLNKVILTEEQNGATQSLGFSPPMFLVISPTGQCNLRCSGCYAAGDSEDHPSLDFKTFDRIIREKRALWRSYFTVISGGEPLLWRDGDVGFVDMLTSHPDEMFMFYTNATLITDEVARRLGESGNVSPAISVEGFEAETDGRRGRGVYRQALEAMARLRKYGVPFGISATPNRHNWRVITSDEFVDFFFFEQGAIYGWYFQYMPIGRGQTLELMVPPVERLEMLRRTRRIVEEKKVFIADFWNSATGSNGCISAGRSGGYYYIDWHGNITPCVFVPYAVDNIHRVYAEGGDLNTPLNSALFCRIREWQDGYGYGKPALETDNWLCPCVMRDHFGVLREAVTRCQARPINAEAAEALQDESYCQGMIRYGEAMKRLTDPIWQREFLGIGRHEGAAEKQVEQARAPEAVVP